MTRIEQDIGTRESNWTGGLAFRDGTIASTLLGMGLGTYPRVALSAGSPTHAPSSLVVKREGETTYLSLTARSSFYLVQRVPVVPGLSYKLNIGIRSPGGPSQLGVALCENLLLYSENCRGASQDVPVSAAIEEEMAQLDEADRNEFLAGMGLDEPGLNRVIRAGYKLLGMQTYFTAGVKEVRAWQVRAGATAPQAAAVIHTDFEKGFIRAETIAYEDYVGLGGEIPAKQAGRMRLEGKDYVVKDGDVMLFRFAT